MPHPLIRIDKLLVERGLARSRADAQEAIAAGAVLIGGSPCARPSRMVGCDEDVSATIVRRYASRGGAKLAAALESFSLRVNGLGCVDIGASTGGFTDCLLQHGAAHVTAIDVGHGQLARALAGDPRVRSVEGVNARLLSPEFPGAPFDLAVVDVSFISLTLVLAPAASVLRPGGELVALIKPQFEVGPGRVGAGGIVRRADWRLEALENVRSAADSAGLTCNAVVECPIRGGDGNIEYLSHWTRREPVR